MLTHRIYDLVQAIPSNVNLFAGGHGIEPLQVDWNSLEINRLARASYDPAFAWAYAVAFAEAKEPLPTLVTEPAMAIREAYEYLLTGKCGDNLRWALVLRQDPMKCALLHALLIMPSVTLEQIAGIVSMPVAVVKLYSELWFDVRDRLDDKIYIANIVWPKTRLVAFRKDYLTTLKPEELLLRVAQEGDLDGVLELFGGAPAGNRPSEEELKERLRAHILHVTWLLVQGGIYFQDLPVIRSAFKIIAASKRAGKRARRASSTWVASTDLPTMGEAVLEAVKAMPVESDSAQSQLPKGPLAGKWFKSSHGSHSSHSSHERQPSVAGPERKTTIVWVGTSHGMRPADAEARPQGDSEMFTEILPGVTDRAARFNEVAIGTK